MLDHLGQIYLITSIVGSAFILISFAMGQVGALVHTGAGHLGHLGHIGGAGHDGGAGGHDFGASGDGGGAGGHDFGASGDSGPAGGHSAQTNAAHAALGSYRLAGLGGKTAHTMPNTMNPYSAQRMELSDRIGFFIIGLLSPMNIAIQMTFFGLGGLVVLKAYPVLGFLSLIPAIIIALCASNLFRIIVGWMVRSMESPPPSSLNEMVGHIGEVNTPIAAGRIGEITYVADARRCHAPAKAQSTSVSLKRGEKVMITDTNSQGVVIVTPWSDTPLEEDFTPTE
jgi:hypothetical protein